jgi:hypothetical protein
VSGFEHFDERAELSGRCELRQAKCDGHVGPDEATRGECSLWASTYPRCSSGNTTAAIPSPPARKIDAPGSTTGAMARDTRSVYSVVRGLRTDADPNDRDKGRSSQGNSDADGSSNWSPTERRSEIQQSALAGITIV